MQMTAGSLVRIGMNPAIRPAEQIRQSVALVTRNRPRSLARTLRSLRAQEAQPWEVIVSDDSNGNGAKQAARVAEGFGCRYLRGPQRGLYANRNHVSAFCTGTHIRTMDDDHEFPPRHFEQCIAALEQDRDSIWIIGEHYPATDDRSVPPLCPGQLHPRGFSVAPADPQNCWAISDGATIFPRALFDRDVRYAEGFKFGAAFLEFGSRLHWLGYRIRHLAGTHVLHHYDPAARSFDEPEAELAARFFAMLCHSYRYQPTLKNKMLTTLEIGREGLLRRGTALRALQNAWARYRQHMSSLTA